MRRVKPPRNIRIVQQPRFCAWCKYYESQDGYWACLRSLLDKHGLHTMTGDSGDCQQYQTTCDLWVRRQS
jgi:hypothetical protein